jgi:hypothetical protein
VKQKYEFLALNHDDAPDHLNTIIDENAVNLYSKWRVRGSKQITGVSLLPIALVLLFVHYRMKRGKRLDSYFHI